MGKETNNYNGWLNSDNFWKRAFAIYGYGCVAGTMLLVSVYLIILVLTLLVGVW